jgi:capsular exopolysaccharide synthesis family protein
MASTENTEYDVDLQKYWFVLKRRWLPAAAVFGSVIGLTALITMFQEPIYQAGGKILLQVDRSASLSSLGENAEGEDLSALSKTSVPIETETEVIQSIPLLQKTVAALNLQDEGGAPLNPSALLGKLEVKGITPTDVLQITYESPDPNESAAVVNELMNLYLQSNIVNNRAEAVAAREFIEKQLPRTEAVVRQKEAALRTFKERNRVVDLEAESQSAVQTIGSLDNQVSQAQAQLAQANARSAELRNKVGMNSQEAIAANSLSQSAGVQKALEEFQTVQSELALLRTRYQEAHPAIADLKSREASLRGILGERVGQVVGSQQQPKAASGNLQVGETRQKLTEELINSEVERLAVANQVSTLSNQRLLYKQRAGVLPRLEQVQSELIQDLDVARSTYADLLRRLQEVRITENQTIGNARVIENAMVPGAPISPRPAFNLAVGGLAGLLLAAATVIILEARDTSVKSVKEARERFRYPLLGSIPTFSERVNPQRRDLGWIIPEIPVRDLPRSATSESYRMLQTSLRFLSSDTELKMIVVTSSVPREGKSTVSANLAASMAQAGRRVLLVDADMRRSSQHQIWELPNTAGLSNVLVGQVELRTAVRQGMENLDVLTAGVLPPNPCALLDSKRMASLFETISDQYDAVIIDTPPLVIAADALILGKMADGVLMVVRPEVANSASITSSKEVIEQSGQNVLGLVVNGVIPGNEPNSYHYAKYHARYYAAEDFSTYEEAKSLAGKNTKHS